MSLGHDTFNLSKTEFTKHIGKIIQNFRCNSKLIGQPREFVLRCCRLTEKWGKLANDPEVVVYLRNIDTAAGRKVKMLSLERGGTKQPVPKAQLVSTLYPSKKVATTPSPEESHYNRVKAAMRVAVHYQLKSYRDTVSLPAICSITGKKILPGYRTDVDHIGMSFSEIADSFLSEKCLKYSDVVLKGPPTAKVFSDGQLWQEWIQYHLSKARYSLTLASANRSKGAQGYQTPKDLLGSFKAKDSESISLDF